MILSCLVQHFQPGPKFYSQQRWNSHCQGREMEEVHWTLTEWRANQSEIRRHSGIMHYFINFPWGRGSDQTGSWMHRKAADRLQNRQTDRQTDRLQKKTDALHWCTTHRVLQWTHSFKKAQTLSAMVLSAVTLREMSGAVFLEQLARLDLVWLPGACIQSAAFNSLPGSEHPAWMDPGSTACLSPPSQIWIWANSRCLLSELSIW